MIAPLLYNIEQIYKDCTIIALLFYLPMNTANNLENTIHRELFLCLGWAVDFFLYLYIFSSQPFPPKNLDYKYIMIGHTSVF